MELYSEKLLIYQIYPSLYSFSYKKRHKKDDVLSNSLTTFLDVAFKPGWSSDFSDNFSNLTQSTEDDGEYKTIPVGDTIVRSPSVVPLSSVKKRFRIMSPAFAREKPFCLNIGYVFYGMSKPKGLNLKVKLVSADSTQVLKDIPYLDNKPNTIKIYVAPLKTSQVSDLRFNLFLSRKLRLTNKQTKKSQENKIN